MHGTNKRLHFYAAVIFLINLRTAELSYSVSLSEAHMQDSPVKCKGGAGRERGYT